MGKVTILQHDKFVQLYLALLPKRRAVDYALGLSGFVLKRLAGVLVRRVTCSRLLRCLKVGGVLAVLYRTLFLFALSCFLSVSFSLFGGLLTLPLAPPPLFSRVKLDAFVDVKDKEPFRTGVRAFNCCLNVNDS